MKTFKKTYLPDSIQYNGGEYKLEQGCANANSSKNDIMDLMCQNKSCIRVEVLSNKLKGKTDFFGQPYKPSIWIFTHQT